MNTGLIATRYATALLGFAGDAGTSAKVYDEMKVMAGVYENVHVLTVELEDPDLSTERKKKIILGSAGNKVCDTTLRFIDLVLEKKREALLRSMVLKYIDLYRKKNNIHQTIITTASAVDEATQKRIISFIASETGGSVELKTKTDPSILGGFVIELGSKKWDGSLSGQLKRIKETYIK
ncbi:MAG: F0F1 ATP synthase subunit delta [Paludibacter sp.]|nr:F0F1 ATP synthase subunit delta [Paludibacter sp.]